MVENNHNKNFLQWGKGENLLAEDIRTLPGI